MKILKEKYPKGTYKGQKTDGRYMDDYLYHNLELLAAKIVDDMTFMGICYSSTLEVGTGKSVLCTQIGEAWSGIMKEKHNIDVPFTSKNICWRPEDLIKVAFEVPQYSFVLLDEWEDATYWSQLGITLRQFFRKCRQLNLFMMVIIPNFFQLPISYAISRSVFAVDVRFQDGFERGFFYFYDFNAKRKIYIKGKKEHNYYISAPTFHGRFLDGYGVPEEEYRASKLADMRRYESQEPQKLTETEIRKRLFIEMHKRKPEISVADLCRMWGISQSSAFGWLTKEKRKENDTPSFTTPILQTYNKLHSNKKIEWNEEKVKEEPPSEQS